MIRRIRINRAELRRTSIMSRKPDSKLSGKDIRGTERINYGEDTWK